jgi:hypothetical protein
MMGTEITLLGVSCALILIRSMVHNQGYLRQHIITCVCDYRRDFRFDIGFTDHFNTQHIITLSYITITDFQIL